MNSKKHKNIFLLVIGLIVVSLFIIAGCRKKAEPVLPTAESSAEDEKIVRLLAYEFTAAFRLENPTPITRLEEIFAEDFCQRTMDGNSIRGRLDNLFYYRSSQEKAQKILRSRTVQYDIKSVRVSPDLAVVFGEVKGDKWFKNAPAPYAANFWEILVFRKIDGRWYLVEEQSIVPKPPKPAESVKPAANLSDVNNQNKLFIGSAGDDAFLFGKWNGRETFNQPVTLRDGSKCNTFRWTAGDAGIRWPVAAGRDYRLQLACFLKSYVPGPNIFVNGQYITDVNGTGLQFLDITIPAKIIGDSNIAQVEIKGRTWVPFEKEPPSPDKRNLGITVAMFSLTELPPNVPTQQQQAAEPNVSEQMM